MKNEEIVNIPPDSRQKEWSSPKIEKIEVKLTLDSYTGEEETFGGAKIAG